MSRGQFFVAVTVISLAIAAIVGWSLITDTGDETSSDLPSDLTEIFNTALVERANVADVAQLEGELRYQDAVDLVHRIDPVIVTITTEVEVPVLTLSLIHI